MERILCIKIASRGDLLLAAPAFQLLRKTRSQAHLTLLVGVSCKDVALHLPYFDEIHSIDDRMLLAGSFGEKLGAAQHLLREMKKRDFKNTSDSKVDTKASFYSEIIIFHRDWRYSILAWLARIPKRRGFYNRWSAFFLTHTYQPNDKEHHIYQYLGLLGQTEIKDASLAGLWRFRKDEQDSALKKAEVHGFVPTGDRSIALGFGGGRNVKTHTELKRWPIASYQRLAGQLSEKGFRVIWIGDKEDAELLGDSFIGINLTGKFSVPETAAILNVCQLVVTNDTLHLHLAEILGIPSLGLFGPTDPAHYRPLGARSAYLWIGEQLPCSPCHKDGYFPPCLYQHRCMSELSVESVLGKIEELLK